MMPDRGTYLGIWVCIPAFERGPHLTFADAFLSTLGLALLSDIFPRCLVWVSRQRDCDASGHCESQSLPFGRRFGAILSKGIVETTIQCWKHELRQRIDMYPVDRTLRQLPCCTACGLQVSSCCRLEGWKGRLCVCNFGCKVCVYTTAPASWSCVP